MSKMSDRDIEKKEAIEKLKGEQIDLVWDLDHATDGMNESSIQEKITIINDQIAQIQQS